MQQLPHSYPTQVIDCLKFMLTWYWLSLYDLNKQTGWWDPNCILWSSKQFPHAEMGNKTLSWLEPYLISASKGIHNILSPGIFHMPRLGKTQGICNDLPLSLSEKSAEGSLSLSHSHAAHIGVYKPSVTATHRLFPLQWRVLPKREFSEGMCFSNPEAQERHKGKTMHEPASYTVSILS